MIGIQSSFIFCIYGSIQGWGNRCWSGVTPPVQPYKANLVNQQRKFTEDRRPNVKYHSPNNKHPHQSYCFIN